jgi:tRNA pseudouridine38-40 synthase
MKNIKAVLEYDGADFAGFQRQPGCRTVQGELERVLSRLLGEPVHVVGAGRTDAGVHATGQVANFLIHNPIPVERLPEVANRVLPRDIAIAEAEEAGLDFHARRDAVSRCYTYSAIAAQRRSPILGRFHLLLPCELDVEPMQEAAESFLGEHDFRAFCVGAAGAKLEDCGAEKAAQPARWQAEQANSRRWLSPRSSTRRFIYDIRCCRDGRLLTISIEANSFLRQMARLIAALLVRIGRGELPPSMAAEILEIGDIKLVGKAAPPCGLCLTRVSYEPSKQGRASAVAAHSRSM